MIPPLAPIGKIVKTHGVEGEVSVVFDVENIDTLLKESAFLMISIEGLPVPFFINSIRSRGADSRLLRLDGICSETAAAPFVGKEVSVPVALVSEFEPEPDDGFYASDLIGFTMLNNDDESVIGEISDINEDTDNSLFVVNTPDGEVLIPITDDFITDIDTDARTITLSLPEGLLEISKA